MGNYFTKTCDSTILQKILNGTYKWMCIGLLITAVTAFFMNSVLFVSAAAVASYNVLFWIAAIAELGLVFYFGAKVTSMSYEKCLGVLGAYSVLNGITLSWIFMAYTATSIFSVFLITAGLFALMSVLGYFTKTDLSSFGKILIYALIGLIIATVVNIFWANSTLYWACTYIGVLIFIGLTAYDTQKIKEYASYITTYDDDAKKTELICALDLYLDFVNLLLYLLRIFGERK